MNTSRHACRPPVAIASVGLTLALVFFSISSVLRGAEAAPAEKPKWQSSAGVAFAYSTGNTKNLLVTLNAETGRKWDRNELQFGASAGYGEAQVTITDPATGEKDEVTEKNTSFARGFGQYNRLFSDKLYGYARVEALHDDIAEIVYRVPLNVGAGYYFVKTTNTLLSLEVGPGYIFERRYNPNADGGTGGYDSDDYASLRAAQRFEHKISTRARIWESIEFLPEITDFGNFILNGEVGVEADLTKKLALRVVAQDTFDNEPPPGRKENDFRLLAGLNYKF